MPTHKTKSASEAEKRQTSSWTFGLRLTARQVTEVPVVGGGTGHVKLAVFGYHCVKSFKVIAQKLKRKEQAKS